MKLFAFNLMNMSDKAHGIQSGHASVKLVRKYTKRRNKHHRSVARWADHDPTIIVLSAGTSNDLTEILHHLEAKKNPFPWALFEEPDWYNVVTSVCVLIPERLYRKKPKILSEWETEFLKLKANCRLA